MEMQDEKHNWGKANELLLKQVFSETTPQSINFISSENKTLLPTLPPLNHTPPHPTSTPLHPWLLFVNPRYSVAWN